jgi:hypothetical protein
VGFFQHILQLSYVFGNDPYRLCLSYAAIAYLFSHWNGVLLVYDPLSVSIYIKAPSRISYVYDPKIRIPQWAHIIYEYEEGPLFVALL